MRVCLAPRGLAVDHDKRGLDRRPRSCLRGQFDFFDVTVEDKGGFRKAWELLLHLPYSERDYLIYYDSCDQLAFLDGHVKAAEHFGGLPRRIVYDNLSAAVGRKVGLEPHFTERFQALLSHYLFEPCFTRRGEGHDKGSVESRGKGIRLQHLTPVPRGNSLAEIRRWCCGRSMTPGDSGCAVTAAAAGTFGRKSAAI